MKDVCEFPMQIDCVTSNLVFPLHNIGLRSRSPTRIIGYVVTVLFVNHFIYHFIDLVLYWILTFITNVFYTFVYFCDFVKSLPSFGVLNLVSKLMFYFHECFMLSKHLNIIIVNGL